MKPKHFSPEDVSEWDENRIFAYLDELEGHNSGPELISTLMDHEVGIKGFFDPFQDEKTWKGFLIEKR